MGLLNKIIVTFTIISVFTTLTQCQRRKVKVNPLASMLKNILSPSNTEGAMQLLKLAAAGTKPCGGNSYLTEEIIVPAGVPQPYPRGFALAPKGYPNMPVTQNFPLLEVAQPVIETIQPIIEVPRGYPKLPVGPVQYQSVPVQNCGPMPYQPAPVQNYGPMPYQPVPVPSCGCQPMVQEKCPCRQVSPAAMVNPFLPAASPVSAIAPPTSSLLPPADPNQCRCNFLRKIPIPPPTL